MSIEHRVVIDGNALPPAAAIISAAKARGTSLELDLGEIQLRSHAGYLPCIVDGHATGFELRADAATPSHEITITTRGDLIELAAAMIIAVAIADSASGTIYDEYSPNPRDPSELYGEASALLDG